MGTRPAVGSLAFAATVAAAAIVAPAPAGAQLHCRPPADSSEAKLLAFFAGPMTFSAAPEVMGLARGRVSIAGDLTLVPSPSATISRSSGACAYKKSENADLSPVFPRPRVAVGLGNGITIEASYLPPVTVADATPNLFGAAISWTPAAVTLPAGARLGLRAHGTFGGVKGPVTCSRAVLQQATPANPCYGTTPSRDTYSPNVRGAEAIVSSRSGTLEWYAGGGVNLLRSYFQVDFTTLGGFHDGNTVEIDLTRVALMAGAVWAWRPSVSLSAQLYSVPDDATTARLGFAWRAR